MKFVASLLIVVGFVSEAAHAQRVTPLRVEPPTKVLIEATSQSGLNPVEILKSAEFRARPGTTFAKLAFAFDKPVRLSAVQIEACSGSFSDGIDLFLHPGARKAYAEGGDTKAVARFQPVSTDVQSLALNFRHNDPVCVKNFKLLDEKGAVISLIEASEPASAKQGRGLDVAPNIPKNPKVDIGISQDVRAKLEANGLAILLDRELNQPDESGGWTFRFREDGSYFLFGHGNQSKEGSRFSSLGEYEIQNARNGRADLVLTGVRIASAMPWGGWICGKFCGDKKRENATRVRDVLVIEKISETAFKLRNRRKAADRAGLPSINLRVRSSTLVE